MFGEGLTLLGDRCIMLYSSLPFFCTRITSSVQTGFGVLVLDRSSTRERGRKREGMQRVQTIGGGCGRGAACGCHGVDGVEDRGEEVRVGEVRVDELAVR